MALGDERFRLCLFRYRGIDCGIWLPSVPQSSPSEMEGRAWLGSYQEILDSWRPDMVITYGGFWMTGEMLARAKRAGARTLFYLCNFSYTQAEFFENVDTTILLSRYHADWYREHVGVEGTPIYPVMPPERILCPRQPEQANPPPKYVTFVNPQPHKGVFLFAKLAEVLGRDRPDIPLLVVEGRASTDWLNRTGAKLSATNLFRMPNTPDPRDYLRVTHIMLVPSVWRESFGRVAAEAMMNGIPVVGSTRGALPEVIGEAGLLLDIPERITPETRELPTDEEILPWKQAIERLWDDPAYYAEIAKRAKSRAELWSVDSIIGEFERL